MSDPALAGYWGSGDVDQAMDTARGVIAANPGKVDDIKMSLLDKDKEIAMRRRLPPGVRMYTGGAQLGCGNRRLGRDRQRRIAGGNRDRDAHRSGAQFGSASPAAAGPAGQAAGNRRARRLFAVARRGGHHRPRHPDLRRRFAFLVVIMATDTPSFIPQVIGIVGLGLVGTALGAAASCVVLAVFNSADVLAVVEGEDGLYDVPAMACIIGCSTGAPEVLEALAARLEQRSIDFIEAPLSGSSQKIAAGAATLLLGGQADALRRYAPVFGAIATSQIHVGGAGMGARNHGIAELLEYARASAMPLAIEPLHPMYATDRACINTLEQALDVCDALDPARTGALGVAVDVYHVWWDPKMQAQIERAGSGPQGQALSRLLAFHVCDWLTLTRDMLNDRGMMGDGVIDIPRIRGLIEANGFAGYSEAEIFSTANWWQRETGEVLRTCIERHRGFV